MKNLPYILRRLSTILAVAVLTLTLIAALTGILLAFYYQPTAGGAYQSLKFLNQQVSNGWLIRTLHDIAGNLVIGVALIQMVVMFLSERFSRTWLSAWVSGILFILSAMGLSWTAIILDWSQVGYWRFKIELGTIAAIPVIGSQLRDILIGGGGIDSITVAHLYTVHSYVLSVGAVGLAIAHLVSLLFQEREMANGSLEQATDADSVAAQPS